MKTAKQWILELNLADKREKNWRDKCERIWSRYHAERGVLGGIAKNNFNILWSNTETIAPAIYNSTPKPDVRRRFKDDDPIGKAVSEVLERSLTFEVECTPFDKACKDTVLDMLLPGRGVARVKYVPTIDEIPKVEAPKNEAKDGLQEETGDFDIALEWEQSYVQHVKWDDFRFGPGRSWDEVSWIAFKHRMGRPELVRLFKEKGEKLNLDIPQDSELQNRNYQTEAEALKTAEIWEIWDKDDKKVIFISKANLDAPMDEKDDPLELDDFFPCPRPMYAVNDTTTLIPTPMYEQYREQAEELDRISGRINKIIDAMKVRGIYDSSMSDNFPDLFRAGDNELIPATSAAVMQEGGFDKAIWFLPIQQMVIVVKELYIQREQCKQVIYELTGISDIIRGTSDPNETLGAQQLKAQWGGQRLQNMQREVQRFARDLIKIMGELIAYKFQPDTIKSMTGLRYPTDAEVRQANAQAMAQYQQKLQMAQVPQPGQPPTQSPPPPQPQNPVTWEQIFKVLKDDVQRAYRVDIETDSTIAANIQQDMEGLQQVLQALSQFMQAAMPLVQDGVLPMEAAKQIMMQICRRSKMGSAVEDAIDQIQQPQPKPDPTMQIEQMKQQGKQQADQLKAQTTQQIESVKAQALAQVEAGKAQAASQIEAGKAQAQMMVDTLQRQHEAAQKSLEMYHEAKFRQMELTQEQNIKKYEADLEAATKITVAKISAKADLDAAMASAEQAANQKTTSDLTS